MSVTTVKTDVVDRTALDSPDEVVVEVRPDCSWEAEGKNEYGATVTLVERL